MKSAGSLRLQDRPARRLAGLAGNAGSLRLPVPQATPDAHRTTRDARRTTDGPPRLLGLKIEDFRRIRVAELAFDRSKGVITLQAPNAGAKSSVGDALEWLLRNKAVFAPPGGRKGERPRMSPVRLGAEKARITGYFKGYTLTLEIDQEGESVWKLRDEQGRCHNAGELLQGWYSAWSFAPDHFQRAVNNGQDDVWKPMLLSSATVALTPAERAEYGITAQSAFDIVTAMERWLDATYEKRRAAGVRVRELQALHESITLPPDCPEAEPNFRQISSDYNGLNARRASLEAEKDRLHSVVQWAMKKRDECRSRASSIEAKMSALACELKTVRAEEERQQHVVDATMADIERKRLDPEAKTRLAELEKSLREVTAQQAKWAERKRKEQAFADWQRQQAGWQELEDRYAAGREFLLALIEKARLAIPELEYRDRQLYIREGKNLIPFAEANEARQRLVSLKVAATALGQQVPFLALRHGEAMTKDTFDELRRFARENDLLIIAEVASDELRKLGDEDVWLEIAA